MGILVFRSITALQVAQNEFETRIVSRECSNMTAIRPHHHHSNLVLRAVPSDRLFLQDRQFDNVSTISMGCSLSQCFQAQSSKSFGTRTAKIGTLLFKPKPLLGNDNEWINDEDLAGLLNPSFVDKQLLNVHPACVITTGALPHDLSESVLRGLTAPWQPRSGFHIEAEVKLITRQFITSPILRDVILNSKPMYHNVSLHPIVETSAVPLPNDTIATAMLRVTLNPGFVYFRSYQDLRVQGGARSSGICDYLQDYRTGTILDVIGSVGGLFALLQAIYVLLFGRSLLWGLTGAILITPFGLVGTLSSKKF
ncbi:hypothetical protein RHS04_00781 [Rhizoctonia solani]|uniref:Uncharacterized protein n=1 Tax=Rhizoctonia solani TaxID=456999 RepID=A0A8H7LRN2_9AGAM|nr:hypothetical protein RHS04_00781 [Rhizoctonia solani]